MAFELPALPYATTALAGAACARKRWSCITASTTRPMSPR